MIGLVIFLIVALSGGVTASGMVAKSQRRGLAVFLCIAAGAGFFVIGLLVPNAVFFGFSIGVPVGALIGLAMPRKQQSAGGSKRGRN
jgi:hypothetical protein